MGFGNGCLREYVVAGQCRCLFAIFRKSVGCGHPKLAQNVRLQFGWLIFVHSHTVLCANYHVSSLSFLLSISSPFSRFASAPLPSLPWLYWVRCLEEAGFFARKYNWQPLTIHITYDRRLQVLINKSKIGMLIHFLPASVSFFSIFSFLI